MSQTTETTVDGASYVACFEGDRRNTFVTLLLEHGLQNAQTCKQLQYGQLKLNWIWQHFVNQTKFDLRFVNFNR